VDLIEAIHGLGGAQTDGGVRDHVAVEYQVDSDGGVTFLLGTYDPDVALVIDQGLDVSAYIGSNGYDEVNGVTTDTAGNVFITGSTTSTNFPVTRTSEQQTLNTNTLNGETYSGAHHR
jgi:hypothetical protein